MKVNKFLFDLGNVFFDWSPHHVFKKIIPILINLIIS